MRAKYKQLYENTQQKVVKLEHEIKFLRNDLGDSRTLLGKRTTALFKAEAIGSFLKEENEWLRNTLRLMTVSVDKLKVESLGLSRRGHDR